MSRARAVFVLCTGLGGAALGLALVAAAVAVSRIDFAVPTPAEVLAACTRWLLPPGDAASVVVLVMGGAGLAVVGLTVSSALRRLRATRQFERALPVTGELAGRPDVRVVRDPVPQAFCAGLVRPRIYVSSGALALLSPAEREAVLGHEGHHARRRDPLRLLVARSLGDGLFFLPAVGRLAERYAALAELAADEAAVETARGRQALASALLAFDSHPDPSVVGIAPERVDRLLGERPRCELPLLLLAGATAMLLALGAVTLRLVEVTDHAGIALPAVLAQACMLAMAVVPLLVPATGLLAARRRRRAG